MRSHLLLIACLCIISQSIFAQEFQKERRKTTSMGPEKGSLLIIGGGRLGVDIYQKFMTLAGGPDAPIVVIPTAGSDESLGRDNFDAHVINRFELYGFTNVSVLHTRDKKSADQKEFASLIDQAKGVFFLGGRQWRLVDAYADTYSEEAFRGVLERGGVIAGSSAGATIQGSYLARGDSKTNTIMMGDHEEGFSYVTNIAIDQHVLKRNRQFDILEIMEAKPELLGIGIDENTAIVVKGNEFEVIGASFVAVYDGTFPNPKNQSEYLPLEKGSKQFYFLKKGDRYNLKKRKVVQEK